MCHRKRSQARQRIMSASRGFLRVLLRRPSRVLGIACARWLPRCNTAFAWQCAFQASRWRFVVPDDAGIKDSQQTLAKQDTLLTRSALSPMTMRNLATVPGLIPNSLRNVKEAWGVSSSRVLSHLWLRRRRSANARSINATRAWSKIRSSCKFTTMAFTVKMVLLWCPWWRVREPPCSGGSPSPPCWHSLASAAQPSCLPERDPSAPSPDSSIPSL